MATGDRDILLTGTGKDPVRSWAGRLAQMGIPVRTAVGAQALEEALYGQPVLVAAIIEGESSLALASRCARDDVPTMLLMEKTDGGLVERSRGIHPIGYSFPPHDSGQLAALVQTARDNALNQRWLQRCRERERLTDELEAMAGLGHWDWDVATDSVLCSAQAARMLGLSSSGRIPMEKAICAIVPAERAEAKRGLDEAAWHGRPASFEATVCHPDGIRRHLELRARALSSPGANATVLGTVLDITVRAKLRRELAQRADELQTILDNIPVMVTHCDRNGRMRRLNRTAEKILGWRQEELHHLDLLTACLPDEEYRRGEFMRSARGWRDIQLTTKAGTLLDTAWTNVTLADGSQLGIGLDIGERKRREEQIRRLSGQRKRALRRLRERELEFEYLAENSPDMIARFDRQFRHLYVNPVFEQVTGLPRARFIGKTNRDLGMPEETVKLWNENLEAVFETGQPRQFDFTFTAPSGRVHTYESKMVPESAVDGRVRTALSIARDVTAHVELEQSLRESERLFRQLTEHINEVFWLIDWPENRVVYVSPAFERIWGRKAEALYENSMLWLDAIVEEERHGVERAFTDTVGSGGYDITFRIRRPDGQLRWIRDRGFAIADEHGKVYRIAGVALDITELKRIQQELQQSLEQLASAKRETEAANSKLAQLSQEDPLTGIGNRRFLQQFVDREWRRERRHRHEVALIMADVDQFKAYNDRYGHAAGDECLRQVAHALAGEIHRPTDIIARYGGEEFAIVLPETELQGAACLAERMRLSVLGLGMPHADSPSGIVTVSFGVAAANPVNAEFGDLLSRADQALYGAKQSGRNRVEVAPNVDH